MVYFTINDTSCSANRQGAPISEGKRRNELRDYKRRKTKENIYLFYALL